MITFGPAWTPYHQHICTLLICIFLSPLSGALVFVAACPGGETGEGPQWEGMQDCNGAQCNTGKADIISKFKSNFVARWRHFLSPLAEEYLLSVWPWSGTESGPGRAEFGRVVLIVFHIGRSRRELLWLQLQLYSARLNFSSPPPSELKTAADAAPFRRKQPAWVRAVAPVRFGDWF